MFSPYFWIALLPFGFYFLIKGADLLVNGASSIAKKSRLSPLMIGLTIVAFGTSLPELFVNVLASFEGATDLAVGNVIGSNITNILLILGSAAAISSMIVKHGTVWKEIPLSLMGAAALFFLANDTLISGAGTSMISRGDGIILIFFFIIFLYYSFGIAKEPEILETLGQEKIAKVDDVKIISMRRSVLFIILGIVLLPIGGQIIVNGSTTLAGFSGLSNAFVGLTIVALGTSLPELATSIMAARRDHSDIAIGNVVGSNIFNLFFVLGLSAVIAPIKFNPSMNTDVLVLGFVTTLLFLFILVRNNGGEKRWWSFFSDNESLKLSRTEGIMLVLMYVGYISFLLWRG